MAGTLTISTLSDGVNSTSATNPILGSAKAWVNFNGTGTPAIRTSYNVSSITRNGTGQYSVNFTNAMTDANYCFQCNAQDLNNGMGVPTAQADPTRTITASSLPVLYNYPPDAGYYDCTIFTVTIFR
jgi:hypothetical protein